MFGLYMQAAVVFLSCSFWLKFLELSCAQGVCYADIYNDTTSVGVIAFLTSNAVKVICYIASSLLHKMT